MEWLVAGAVNLVALGITFGVNLYRLKQTESRVNEVIEVLKGKGDSTGVIGRIEHLETLTRDLRYGLRDVFKRLGGKKGGSEMLRPIEDSDDDRPKHKD